MQAVGADEKILGEKYIIIIKKPKLKFPKKVTFEDGKTIDGYEYFKTQDTKNTAADSWESSNTVVANVDNNGIITLNGVGKTVITANFCNVIIKEILNVTY